MMLKQTGVQIELLSDIDQILFIENSIRGGLSFINQRYARRHKTQKRNVELHYVDGGEKMSCIVHSDFIAFFSHSE